MDYRKSTSLVFLSLVFSFLLILHSAARMMNRQLSIICLKLSKFPHWVSQVAQEMQVWSLGQEDLLEEEMATHSSILAWESLWTEEPDVL